MKKSKITNNDKYGKLSYSPFYGPSRKDSNHNVRFGSVNLELKMPSLHKSIAQVALR